MQQQWKESLGHCDSEICLLACFCPAVAFAETYALFHNKPYDSADCCRYWQGCPPCSEHTELRNSIRQKYNIADGGCSDTFATWCWSGFFGFNQEWAELNSKGHGIAKPQTQTMTVTAHT